jgi:hypothetical protein
MESMTWTSEPDGAFAAQVEGGRASVSNEQTVWCARVLVGSAASIELGFPDQATARAWAEQRVQELLSTYGDAGGGSHGGWRGA